VPDAQKEVARVAKRLIEIDDELLEFAMRELGTASVADTVRAALGFAAARPARVREVEWLVSGGMAEMADPRARDGVWH
jgi:CO/xanthine dehydrogenase FAD-binding subunit